MASKTKVAGKGGRSSTLGTPASARSDRKSARAKEQKAKEENRETLAWKIITSTQTKELAELETPEKLQEHLAELMKLPLHQIDLKDAAILDYYTAALWWGKEQSYNAEQLSALFTVVHTLLENVKDKHLTIVENLKEFKKMLAGVGVENSDISGGLECFDSLQVKNLTDYMYTSLFQHYNMYTFMFTHTQAEEIIGTDLDVEVAKAADVPWPPPLEEGVAQLVYQEHIATPPPTPAPQEDVAMAADNTAGAEVEDGAAGIDLEKEADLMSRLTIDEVKTIINSVFDEMLGGLQAEIQGKLREKENNIITRINKIHKVAEK